MPVHVQKKAAAAFEAFNASGKIHILDDLIKTLQRRHLGAKHFDQALTLFEHMRQSALIKITDDLQTDRDRALARRILSLTLLYMGIGPGLDGKLQYYRPTILRDKVTQVAVTTFSRNFPIMLQATHVEDRFVERACHALDYQSKGFQLSLQWALAIAKSAGALIDKDHEAAKIAVPHTHGIFFGDAVRHTDAEDLYSARTHITIANDIQRPKKESAEGENKGENEEENRAKIIKELRWIPEHTIMLRTFIAERDMSGKKLALYRSLRRAFQNPVIEEGTRALMESYTWDVPEKIENARAIENLDRAIRNVLETPEWIEYMQSSQHHLVAHGFK